MRTPSRTRLGLTVALMAAAAVAIAPPRAARAQGIADRARGMLNRKTATGQTPPGAVEITPALLSQFLKGIRAGAPLFVRRDAAAQRAEADQKRLSQILDANSAAEDGWRKEEDKSLTCRQAAFSRIDADRQTRLDAKSKQVQADPMGEAQRMQKIQMKYVRQIVEAQQRGDTATQRKLNLQMQSEMIGMKLDPAADTAQADRQCGKLPPKPAWMVEADSLRTEVNELTDRARVLEDSAELVGASTSGLDREKYAGVRERVGHWYRAVSQGKTSRDFSASEDAALQSRRTDIDRIAKALDF